MREKFMSISLTPFHMSTTGEVIKKNVAVYFGVAATITLIAGAIFAGAIAAQGYDISFKGAEFLNYEGIFYITTPIMGLGILSLVIGRTLYGEGSKIKKNKTPIKNTPPNSYAIGNNCQAKDPNDPNTFYPALILDVHGSSNKYLVKFLVPGTDINDYIEWVSSENMRPSNCTPQPKAQ